MDDARLSRIEQKLDKLADAMVSLVRVEERIGTIFNRLDIIDARLAEHSKRISNVEKTSDGRGVVFRLVDRLFWIIVTAAVGLVTYFAKG